MSELSKIENKKKFEYKSLSVIAKEKGLSGLFLKQIAISLKKAGLIESKEGISGGYKLSRNSNKIQLSQILESISSDILSPGCVRNRCSIDKHKCSCFSLWTGINTKISNYLQNITLKEFVAL
jgi:Rrf2 family protein